MLSPLQAFMMSIELVCFRLVVRKLTACLCILRLFSPVYYTFIREDVFLK